MVKLMTNVSASYHIKKLEKVESNDIPGETGPVNYYWYCKHGILCSYLSIKFQILGYKNAGKFFNGNMDYFYRTLLIFSALGFSLTSLQFHLICSLIRITHELHWWLVNENLHSRKFQE